VSVPLYVQVNMPVSPGDYLTLGLLEARPLEGLLRYLSLFIIDDPPPLLGENLGSAFWCFLCLVAVLWQFKREEG